MNKKFRPSLQMRFYIITGLLFVFAGVVAAVGLFPLHTKFIAIQQDLYVVQQEVESQYVEAERERRSYAEIDDIEEALRTMPRAAIQKGEELSIIEALETLAQNTGLTQSLSAEFVDFSSKSGSVFSGEYRFQITASGQYEQILTLLDELYAYPVYVRIENIRIDSAGSTGGSEPPTLSATFVAAIFVE